MHEKWLLHVKFQNAKEKSGGAHKMCDYCISSLMEPRTAVQLRTVCFQGALRVVCSDIANTAMVGCCAFMVMKPISACSYRCKNSTRVVRSNPPQN